MPTAIRPGKRRQASRTTSGCSTATVPKITRSTPSPRSAPARSTLRTPPPTSTGIASAAHSDAMMAAVHRLARHRAVEIDDVQILRAGLDPAAAHGDRVVAVHGLALHVAAQQAHALAALEVDGRQDQHAAPAPSHDRAEVAQKFSDPDRADSSRDETGRRRRCPAPPRRRSRRRSRVDVATTAGSSDSHVVGVDEVDEGAVGDAGEQRRRALLAQLVPAHVRARDNRLRRCRGSARSGRAGPPVRAPGRTPRSPRRAAADRGRCRGTASPSRSRAAPARRGRNRADSPCRRRTHRLRAIRHRPPRRCAPRRASPPRRRRLARSAFCTLRRLPMP